MDHQKPFFAKFFGQSPKVRISEFIASQVAQKIFDYFFSSRHSNEGRELNQPTPSDRNFHRFFFSRTEFFRSRFRSELFRSRRFFPILLQPTFPFRTWDVNYDILGPLPPLPFLSFQRPSFSFV